MSDFNIEPWIMPALSIAGALITVAIGYVTLQANMKSDRRETERRFGEGENDRKDLRMRIEHLDREKVNREDFIRFDDKIGVRFEKIEHAVNNGALKTTQMIKEALRDMLPIIRGKE